MAEEPFNFPSGYNMFFRPNLLQKINDVYSNDCRSFLFFCILIFHEDTQVKLIYLLAFVWVFGSISALSVSAEKITK